MFCYVIKRNANNDGYTNPIYLSLPIPVPTVKDLKYHLGTIGYFNPEAQLLFIQTDRGRIFAKNSNHTLDQYLTSGFTVEILPKYSQINEFPVINKNGAKTWSQLSKENLSLKDELKLWKHSNECYRKLIKNMDKKSRQLSEELNALKATNERHVAENGELRQMLATLGTSTSMTTTATSANRSHNPVTTTSSEQSHDNNVIQMLTEIRDQNKVSNNLLSQLMAEMIDNSDDSGSVAITDDSADDESEPTIVCIQTSDDYLRKTSGSDDMVLY
ncbi:unnamed protein product [Medioppia subpectinata]|uniref:Uncharacterized protein n=1 Tax=Medioppia subpectinata TaxID=1979941 RepID=A0A7R9KQ71_9ACAR|nr:unnamed protein product [Medioppia subpectinata]CAG2107371.1 unnamed protein product [Medioppia subpectinata]